MSQKKFQDRENQLKKQDIIKQAKVLEQVKTQNREPKAQQDQKQLKEKKGKNIPQNEISTKEFEKDARSNLDKLMDASMKEEILQKIEQGPNELETILKEIQQLQGQYGDRAAEIFEQKYFRSYVYVVDQYFKVHKGDLSIKFSENIRIASRIAQIYQNLGKLSFQKQEVFAKKMVQIATEIISQVTLNDLNKIFFIMSTFSLKNENEDKLFIKLRELIQGNLQQKNAPSQEIMQELTTKIQEKNISSSSSNENEINNIKNQKIQQSDQEKKHNINQNVAKDLKEFVEIHFNVSKIASQRNAIYEKNSILVLVDLLNSLLQENSSNLTNHQVAKCVSSLSLVKCKVNKLQLISFVNILNTKSFVKDEEQTLPSSTPQQNNKKPIKNDNDQLSLHKQMSSFIAITSLEDIYTGGFFYLFELDEYYSNIIQLIHKSIDSFSPSMLGTISSSLQRISYYDSSLILKIAKKVTSYDLYGFQEKDQMAETVTELKSIQKKIREFIKQQKETDQSKTSPKDKENPLKQETIPQDQQILQQLYTQEKQLKQKVSQIRKLITKSYNNLNSLFKIAHCLAQFNIRNDEQADQKIIENFLKYFYQVLELYSLKLQQEGSLTGHFEPKYVSRCIWALCVLDKPSNISKPLHVLVNNFLFQDNQQLYFLNKADISVLYYSYLLNQKHARIFPQSLLEVIQSVYSQQVLKGNETILNNQTSIFLFVILFYKAKKTVSMLCMDVQKHLEDLKIQSRIEMNLDNILVDIQIPNTLYGKQIVLDVHGYQHYFRNSDRLKGNSVLKKAIIEEYYNYVYEIVPIFEWELLDKAHKHEYLLKLLENLKIRINEQNNKVKEGTNLQ